MQHWDAYWQNTKTLNSFAEGEQASGYTGDIAKFWQKEFANLNDNATVLDVATGNGALAVLALQCNNQLNVFASDIASVSPLTVFTDQDDVYPLLKQVQFYPNMATEQLAFADAQFDMVVSQFGLEYGDIEVCLAQLRRVLKPAGRAVAMVHHSHSFISTDCKVGISVINSLLAKDGLVDKCSLYAELCQYLQRFGVLSAEQSHRLKLASNTLLNDFRQLQLNLQQNEQEWFNLLIKDLVALLADWRLLVPAKVTQIRQAMQHFKQRIADQVEAAWSEDDAKRIKKQCLLTWQAAEIKPMSTAEGILCWLVSLGKA